MIKKAFPIFVLPFGQLLVNGTHIIIYCREKKYQSSPKTKLIRIQNFQSVNQKYFEPKIAVGRSWHAGRSLRRAGL